MWMISESDTLAYRKSGFCNGIVLSSEHILPGQLLLVEITETQIGWSGNLRLGFTLLDDDALTPLPTLSLPGLNLRGSSWIISLGNAAAVLLSEHQQRLFYPRDVINRQIEEARRPLATQFESPLLATATAELNEHHLVASYPHQNKTSSKPCPCCLHTSFGRVPLCTLIPKDRSFPLRTLDIEKGSLIGIYYELEGADDNNFHRLRIHLVINGVDLLTTSVLLFHGKIYSCILGTNSASAQSVGFLLFKHSRSFEK
ncbi:Neuralized-like protein 2 [Cichlidogyrus casuarinus]|uniref:Neuralized-like protein 2 n=1 Tax=Cichlidogyrus casuarinus TaxID=1844966 RepID=A0ABD2QFG4_9PLAT